MFYKLCVIEKGPGNSDSPKEQTLNHQKKFVIIVVLCCSSIAFADADEVGKYNIGAGAGYVTGVGLSYRQWINNWGFQITTAPYYQDGEYNTTSLVSFGVTALRIIKESKFVNLFVYAGPHGFYYRDYYKKAPVFPDDGYEYYYSNELVKRIIVGGGPGLDFHFLRISISVMCGIAGSYELVKKNSGVNFTGETALYYSF